MSWYGQGTSLDKETGVAPVRPAEMQLYSKWEVEGVARNAAREAAY